jgi:hypothetical protein
MSTKKDTASLPARDPENLGTEVKGGGASGAVRTERTEPSPDYDPARDGDMTPEERELAKPVAAVPASVNLDDIEPADGFRLPRDQPEAETARQQGEEEARDASRPDVAQRLADEAQGYADQAAEAARLAQERADMIKDAYKGPDRPPLDEGWRYKKPEPDVHDPV